MSTTIDNRVVEMRFDNKQFESNVSTTMSTLDKLKQKLNLQGASKGLEDVGHAAKNIDMSGLSNGIQTVNTRFSALQIAGVTALANITNSAVNAGKRIASALTIDPIKTGFSEYETQIGAVQTILANTESKGTNLQDVNRALDELNTYADKTIYNFTEMTRNIGTFTAAGVDLETSVKSIQGIANLAAVSGSTSQQASTAMYQLSQALAAGKVQLMDWNSVVNAGMGGEVFQNALIRTAAMLDGSAKDLDSWRKKNIDSYGSFRESLTRGEWLTSEVLTKTLEQFTLANTEANKEMLISQGYTEEQAASILKMAETAENAATKVKTFSQLWETLKESAQSGWTQTWEIIVGDFEEAKDFLTRISEGIGGLINGMSDARNAVLSEGLSSGWKQLLGSGIGDEEGYKDEIKKIAKDHGVAIDQMIEDEGSFEKALKKGLETGQIKSEDLSKSVFNLADKIRGMSEEERKAAGYTDENVKALEKLEAGLKDGSVSIEEFTNKIMRPSGRENIIESIFNAAKGLMSVIKPITSAFKEIFPALTGEQLYGFTERLREFTEGLTISSEVADKIKRTFKGVFAIFDIFRKVITSVVEALFDLGNSSGIESLANFLLDITAGIGDFFTSINEGFDTGGLVGMLSKIVSGISSIFESSIGHIESFGDAIAVVGDFIANIAGKVWNVVKSVLTWFSDTFSVADIFAGLAGGGIFLVAKKISGFLDKAIDAIKGLFGKDGNGIKILDQIKDVLGSVHEALNAFATGIKITSLVAIAVAIGILSMALRTISEIDTAAVIKSLVSIGIMLGMLTWTMSSISKTLDLFGGKGLVRSGISLILVATAINILAKAMEKIGKLPVKEIAKGLIGVGGGLLILSAALKIIDKTKISIKTSIAIVALATACSILGDALKKFGSMTWDEIARGLTAMGGALLELVAALAILNAFGGFQTLFSSLGILILVQGLSELADGLKKFGEMDWTTIGHGLVAMGGSLLILGGVLGGLGKFAGFSSIFASGAILIVIQGLDDLAESLKKFGEMDWTTIGHGLTAMGGALTEVAGVTGALGKIAGFSAIFGSGAIFITIQGLGDLADAFTKFGRMAWGEIGRGLSAMGGALLEVGAISGGLGILAGISGLFGAGTIYIAVQGLSDLADSFKKFGQMAWDEIGRGLVGMGGALAEVAIVSGALGALTGLAGLIGGGSLLLAVQGLGDIADAMKKFGEMSWDEIKRGLAGMGAALGEVALGGLLSTLSGIGAISISAIAEPLGDLADSVKKWAGVSVPEGLGTQLAILASGVEKFTFAGLGSLALSGAAASVGTLADSVKKWTGVTVPEDLPDKLKLLADGVEKFWLAGVGASALSDAAPAVGQLADSVKKWSGVSVPENIKTDMANVADGVKAFSFAFAGGWSMSSLVKPLGDLPASIQKWSGVTVPEGLDTQLISLADGIKAFSFAFMGGWSIEAVIGPLGDLSGAVMKWQNVIIPESLGPNLKSLAEGIRPFGTMGDISSVSTSIGNLVSGIKNLSGIAFETIGSGLNTVATAISGFASKISKSGGDLIDGLIKGIKSKQSSLNNATKNIIESLIKAIESNKEKFKTYGVETISNFIKGILTQRASITICMNTILLSAITGIRSGYSGFYSAGEYLISGLVAGILAGRSRAIAAAVKVAVDALEAAKDALGIASPSKEFYALGRFAVMGLVNALGDYARYAYHAGEDIANSAKNGLSGAISKVSDLLEFGIDDQPTIRPVLDLSDIEAGAGRISGMFGMTPSVAVMSNVGSISASMNRRQNGTNNDVISAIRDLGKALGNSSGDVYMIDGVTYDDGSNVSSAVKELVHAAKVERRR